MYQAYFRFQKRPFAATPDATCFYNAEPIQNVLDELILRVASAQGISILTAPAGTGKTLICRRLVMELGQQFTPIFLANANYSTRRELLQSIHYELGRRYSGMEEQELRLELISSLKGLAASGRPAVLIVDEAHLLNERLLEEIRSLGSLSEGEQPLLRAILAGQLALEMRLIDPAMEALNQRIVCHAYLESLTRQQSREYIEYRVQWAGGNCAEIFDAAAIERIAESSNGLPRCLNQLADHSLLLAFVHEEPRVTRKIVEDALADLKQLPLLWNEPDVDLESESSIGLSEDEDELCAWESEESPELESRSAWAGEPAAAFELGSTDAAPSSPDSGPSETQFAPVAEPGVRVFQEEVVDDRYAVLDQNRRRAVGTFDETPLFPAVRAVAPSPAPSAAAETLIVDPSELVDARTVDGDDDSDSRLVDGEGIRLDDAAVSECAEVVCDEQEVQSALPETWAAPMADGVDISPDVDLSDDPSDFYVQYDVVEPIRTIDRVLKTVDDQLGGRPDPAPAGRYVPKPNYRLVFSTLRRRLGRTSRARG